MTYKTDLYEDYRGEVGVLTAIDTRNNSIKTLFKDSDNSQFFVQGRYGIRFIDNNWYEFLGFKGSLYRVDLKSGAHQRMASTDALGRSWLIDPNGAIAAQSIFDTRSGDWVVKANGRELIHKTSPLHDYYLRGFSNSTDAVLVQDETGASPRLFELSIAADAPPRELWSDFDWRYTLHSRSGLLLSLIHI